MASFDKNLKQWYYFFSFQMTKIIDCPVRYLQVFAITTSPTLHLVCPPKILHNLCFPFLLGVTVVPRETEDDTYAKFWGANKVY